MNASDDHNRPTDEGRSLIAPAEIAALLGQPITLTGQSSITLAPLASCGEAADALREVLDGMEESYHEIFFPTTPRAGAPSTAACGRCVSPWTY